jgi:histidinol-phosphatase (PHP family)
MHSKLCGHATGELEEYVQRGIALGLDAVGFAFHLPIAIPVDYKINITHAELDLLVPQVEALRAAYRDDIPVLLGGEADYLPGSEAEAEALVTAYPFDHVVGSVHFVGDWAFDSPRAVHQYDHWDIRKLYETYFGLVCDAMDTGIFDIVGHADIVKKFGFRPQGDWSDLLEAVARSAARAGMCVEINTGGRDKPAGEFYGTEPLVRSLHAAGVPVCFGSDAHAPEEVARYFDEAVALARACGYTEYATFRRRRRELAPIPVPQIDKLSP